MTCFERVLINHLKHVIKNVDHITAVLLTVRSFLSEALAVTDQKDDVITGLIFEVDFHKRWRLLLFQLHHPQSLDSSTNT